MSRANLFFLVLFVSHWQPLSAIQGRQADADERQRLKQWLDESYEYRFSDPDSSLYFGFKALEAAKAAAFPDVEADALRSISTTYQAQGDYPRALDYGFEALRLSQKLDDQLKAAHSLNIIGMVYDQQGSFPQALDHYRAAYDIYKTLGDDEWLAMIAVNLGILFKGQGEYEQVIPYYHDAYAIYRKLDLPAEAAFCETNLGSVFYHTQQYDSCVYYSLKAEKELAKLGYVQIQPTAQCNAGLGYFGLGRHEESRGFLEKALHAHRKYANKKEIAFVLIQLSKVYQELGLTGKSYAAVAEAKQVAAEIGAAQETMDASKLLAAHYVNRNDYRRAYREYVDYSNVKDTLFEGEKVRALTNYQVFYETEKKERQIETLNQEAAIQRLRLKQRTTFLLAALGVFLAAGIATYFILKQRKMEAEARLQQEMNAQQEKAAQDVLDAEERERRRIASDLHDGVGQTLSAALLNLNYLYNGINEGKAADLQIVDNALAMVRSSYQEMRSISHQMMPNALLKAGLAASIKEFLDVIDGKDIKVHLSVSGLSERLDQRLETVLYRAVQEAVNNVVKHARASRLTIQLMKDGEGVSVTIEDNGMGFDASRLDDASGIGLKNIRSRVAMLQGSVEVDAALGRGTAVVIFIPI